MRTFSLLATALYVLIMWLLGVRLLLKARVSRAVPEASLGVFFLVGVGLGYGPGGLLYMHEFVTSGIGEVLGLACNLAMGVGTAAMYVFTWRVFHSRDRWARLVTLAAIAAIVLSGAAQAATSGFAPGHEWGPAYGVSVLLRAVGFAWASVESLRFYAAGRSRLRLGLIDPMTVRRFLLWGIACALLLIPFAAHLVAILTSEQSYSGGQVILVGGIGAIAATLIWLAFFPPSPRSEEPQQSTT